MRATIEQAFAELGLTDADRETVSSMLPQLPEALVEVTDRFYRILADLPVGRRLAGFDVETLKAQQIAHWTRLFTATIDDEDVRRVVRIGLAHRRLDILPDAYMRAYGWFAGELVAALMRRSGKSATEFAPVAALVVKLACFDMSIALRVYDASFID